LDQQELVCILKWCIEYFHRTSLHGSHKKSNKMQRGIKIYFIFVWSSTCSGRHTAHHQEPKTALAATGFAHVEGCCMLSCWTLSALLAASSNYTFNNPPRLHKQRLLMQFQAPDDGRRVTRNMLSFIQIWNKFWYTCILLNLLCELCYDARINEHQCSWFCKLQLISHELFFLDSSLGYGPVCVLWAVTIISEEYFVFCVMDWGRGGLPSWGPRWNRFHGTFFAIFISACRWMLG
jgi:hypothetical protein